MGTWNPEHVDPALRAAEAARRAIDVLHAAEARRAEAAERDPDQACPECAEKDAEIARLQAEVERLGSAIEEWRESARGEDQ